MNTALWTAWMPRLSAFAVALALTASVVFWVLRWPAPDAANALPVAMASEDEVPLASASDVARLLGAVAATAQATAPVDASSRFQLTGIVALGAGTGVALVSVDGKPAKPYRVGSQLDDGWVLQSVEPRSVALGADASGPARLKLDLPQRQP